MAASGATRKPSNLSVCVIAVASLHLAVVMLTMPLEGGQVQLNSFQ